MPHRRQPRCGQKVPTISTLRPATGWNGDGFYHLGDLNLRLKSGDGDWRDYSTAAARRPVEALPASAPVLAAADLAATLPEDIDRKSVV